MMRPHILFTLLSVAVPILAHPFHDSSSKQIQKRGLCDDIRSQGYSSDDQKEIACFFTNRTDTRGYSVRKMCYPAGVFPFTANPYGFPLEEALNMSVPQSGYVHFQVDGVSTFFDSSNLTINNNFIRYSSNRPGATLEVITKHDPVGFCMFSLPNYDESALCFGYGSEDCTGWWQFNGPTRSITLHSGARIGMQGVSNIYPSGNTTTISENIPNVQSLGIADAISVKVVWSTDAGDLISTMALQLCGNDRCSQDTGGTEKSLRYLLGPAVEGNATYAKMYLSNIHSRPKF